MNRADKRAISGPCSSCASWRATSRLPRIQHRLHTCLAEGWHVDSRFCSNSDEPGSQALAKGAVRLFATRTQHSQASQCLSLTQLSSELLTRPHERHRDVPKPSTPSHCVGLYDLAQGDFYSLLAVGDGTLADDAQCVAGIDRTLPEEKKQLVWQTHNQRLRGVHSSITLDRYNACARLALLSL